jgi:MarR family transcriptional regulator for hemolysin
VSQTDILSERKDADGQPSRLRLNLPPDNRRRSIGVKLAVLARQMRQRFDTRVEAMGVTRAKWMLIATVAHNPGVTQRNIASLLEVTDVTAGRLIDRMCADGLLERKENPQDRRAYCVDVTAAAEPVLKNLAAAVADYEEEVFAMLDESELATLDRLLDKLSKGLVNSRDT